jgi:hypothetical protein
VRTTRRLRACAVGLAVVCAADVLIGATWMRDGLFRGRPLPPFGAITNPDQRAWLEFPPSTEAASSDRGQGRFDADLGWANLESYSSPDGSVTVDSIGARGPSEYPPSPPAGALRVTCFGDSFTWCDVVTDDDAWPRRVERLGSDTEMINFGVSGYGTDQALLRFRHQGRGLGADVVLIGIMLDNIGRNVNRYRPFWYPRSKACVAKPRFRIRGDELTLVPIPFADQGALVQAVKDGSVVALLAEHEYWRDPALGPLRYSALGRLAAGYFAYKRRSVPRLWTDFEGEPYGVTRAIVETFHEEARADGARAVAVLLFPREDDLSGLLASGERYWQAFADELNAAGIGVIDLSVALAAASRGSDTSGLYASGHLNAFGNLAVARTVADWLEAHRDGL